MSVTVYDGQYSFRQNELATKGIQHGGHRMSAEQSKAFESSPFMVKARQQEQYVSQLTGERDKMRKQTDKDFNPCDEDFTAPKAYDYDKGVNYYTVLGVDEYAPLEEIKKAYKKLSLIYHPDKMASLSKEEQEERAGVFIEIKNAYLVLGDQATRRQYDRDRDFATAGSEVNGYSKRKDRAPFDATELMKKIQEHYKPPGREVDVEVRCKLEKFFYGGTKQVTRSRRIYRDFQEFHEDKQYRLDVPKGAAESWECKMKGGDMNLEMQTDTLRFVVKSKPHKVLERRGGDLHLLREVRLRPDAHLQPFLQTAVSTVEGRTVLLWGQNPLYSQAASSSTVLHVSVEGEGIGDTGHLHLSARVGAKTGSCAPSQETRIVTVKTTYTKIQFYVGVSVPASLEDLQESIREVLQWPEDHPVNLRRCSSEQPFGEQSILETEDSEVILECRAQCVAEVPMSLRRARDLLGAMAAFAGTDAFEEGLSGCLPAVGTARHEGLLRKLWEPACRSALLCGYEPSLEGLWKAAQRALWLLREEPDGETMRLRFADFGFEPKEPPKPRPPRRRKLPRPEVENFLIRNALGPATWSDCLPDPGSETEPEEEAPDYEEKKAQQLRETEEHERAFQNFLRHGAGHAPDRRRAKRLGPFGAAAHPLMLRRAAKRAELASECSLQLRPLFCGEPMQLFTKPTCFLQFYSNAGQSAHARPGQLEPTPMFAVAVCCPTGAKKAGKEEWMRLRHPLLPALKHMLLICLGRARNLLPRQLLASPASSCYAATTGVSVNSGGVESGADVADESSEGEDNAEVIQLAKKRVEESRGETCDFDDLDLLDELEAAASLLRKERREQRRRRRAARESWMREAKREANPLDGSMPPTAVAEEVGSTLWKQLATDAVKSGDYYLAQWYYSKEAYCYGLLAPEMERDEHENEKKDDENHVLERAVVLSNRSLCLCRVHQAEAALRDARSAAALRPDWARAWSRIGAAAFAQSAFSEACEAWRKAVQLDSCEENLRGLEEVCRRRSGSSVRECKEQGNLALRGKDWGLAICCYTEALAGIPAQKYMEQSDTAIQDDYSLLRCILFSNRSAAFASAGRWQAAVRDAKCAVAEGQASGYPKAFCRLGVALLGCSENERAYTAFASALRAEERNLAASKGRQSCLQLAPRWSSSAAAYRRRRFLRDAGRPKCRTRVFLLSELRFGQGSNEAWVHGIHATKFLDDVLILTGNVADSFRALERGLTALRSKFRRIFFVPGNNEMWITPVEMERFPDSVCKFWAILEMCDRLGVDVAPAAICEGVYVVPLFSWYNAEFDVTDPFPDAQLQHDKYAKWPMDPNHQVWRYMLALNRDYLQKPYHDTVITCSHFVPRSELPVVQEFSMAKASGCAELDDQLRQARSSCHVYGHSSKQCGKEIEGVIYLNAPHKGGGLEEPIPCVFNGEKVCCEMVSVH